ncbi:MAG: TonB-dependent receptor, partial [Candidatus Omnitrophica bacterium]|nr:TonB-dependent receptor [Candidatus Omnitrophota bacterium]
MGSHFKFRTVLLGFVLLAFAAACCASEGSSVELGTVLVSPRRIPGLSVDAATFPGSATVLTQEEISKLGVTTVPDAISRTMGAGLTDQQGFGLGSDSTLNLRGIVNSSRTNALVLVDGVRQNRLTGDDVHWQSIPVDQVERIEVLRGGSSLIYGEGALGGVVNITTKQASEKAIETDYGVEAGSFGWQRHTLSARGQRLGARYAVNASRRLVDGYREFSWSRNTTITAHAGLELSPALDVAWHVLHSEDTTAFPGGLTLAQTEQRRQQTNSFHGINTNETDQVSMELITAPWEGFSSVINLFWKNRTQTSEDSINFNAFTLTPSKGLSIRTNQQWRGSWLSHLLVTGIEFSDEKATTGDQDAFAGPDSESNREGYGLFFEETLSAWDRLSIVTGLRFDKSHYEEALAFPDFTGTLGFEGFSPKIAARYAILPEGLNVFGSYARPFKAPNVDDLSARTPSYHGNVNLEPQQADTYELGLKANRKGWSAESTFFYTRIDDEILVDGLSSQNQNFDTRRVGMECSLDFENLQRGLRGRTAYTFVDAEFIEGAYNERTIPGTPEHTLFASFGVSPLTNFWIDLDWRLVQDFFRINDMENRLGGADNYGVLSLRMRYDVPERWLRRG